MGQLEYTSEQDHFFDYCLYKYKPSGNYENKFRSINLLYHSFNQQGCADRILEIVRTIRQAVGISNTVWGAKFGNNTLSWEFYFYDYRRRGRERSTDLLLRAIAPIVPCEIKINENLEYFMFSIDIDARLICGNTLDEIHVYIGNPTSPVSSGMSYSFTKSGSKLENFYFFFDPKKHLKQIIEKVRSSSFFDPVENDIESVLWPELMDCKTICVANKQKNDCVYFSRITVDQLLVFLARMKYPEEIISFVKDNRSRLDHLLYDVGIDYKNQGNGLILEKSGYYGFF